MTLIPLDYDRGLILKTNHARGMLIASYLDDPGVYYAPNGAPVSADLAREAGFDVEDDLKERARLERRATALAAIDKEFGVMAEGEIVKEAGDFRVVHLGFGWFDVLDDIGAPVSPKHMRRDEADAFLDSLVKAKEHIPNGTKAEGRQGPLTK